MKGVYILVFVLFLLLVLWFGIFNSMWGSSKKRRENEPDDNNVVMVGMKVMLLVIIPVFAWIMTPQFGGGKLRPFKNCHANQRVIAGSIEGYYKVQGIDPDPINLNTGKIYLKLLREKEFMKGPIMAYHDCLYVGFPYASGSVEVFCLSCGFGEQKEKSIVEEFKKRFTLASPSTSLMNIDFSAATDYSQQDNTDFMKRVRPYYGFPLVERFISPFEEKQ